MFLKKQPRLRILYEIISYSQSPANHFDFQTNHIRYLNNVASLKQVLVR